MTTPDSPAPGDATSEVATLWPLLPSDPPRVGGFWVDARLVATASGVAFVGRDDAGTPAMIVLLSEGAAGDAAARERLAGTVNTLHIDTVLARGGQGQDSGRLGVRYRPEPDAPGSDDPVAPWVALAYDGSPRAVAEASRILAEIDLSWLPLQGRPAGPDFRLHWIDKVRPGVTRVWPLPWPGRRDRAGWLSILVSWLLMMLLMILAVLIAILIFQNSSTQQPPPPVPTSASASGGGSPSPQSGSPSPESGSPSPQSASPSPESASPEPSPSGSEGGSPTPNSKL